MPSQAIYSRRFVDRRVQLDLLAERFAAAAAGRGCVVLISGEAGTGKSRLVAEFCASLPAAAARCAVGRCLEYVQSPFAPFLAAIGALALNEPAVLRDAVQLRSELAPLIPELAAESSPPAGERDRLRQFNALAEALHRFAARTPTVVAIEDLHWADSGTLELLQHVVPYAARSRLLVIATYRLDEQTSKDRLASVMGKMQRDRSVFATALDPLGDADMHELIYHALGGRDVSTAAAAGICSRAEGNPLFAEELLKAVIAAGPTGEPRELPGTVREALRDRLAGLDEGDRTLLTQAAAIGRRFGSEFLAQVAGASVPAVLAALKRAIAAQFVVEEDEDARVLFAFRHQLVREALYDELLADEARALHRRIALTIENEPGWARRDNELAYHYGRARDAVKAAQFSERAGDAAFEFFAYRDAVEAYERALAGATADRHKAAINRKLADALHQCGDGDRAKAALESALRYYDLAGEREEAAQTCLRLAVECLTLGDTQGHERLSARALDLVGDDPSSPAFFLAHIDLLDLYTTYRWNPAKAQTHVAQAERAQGERAEPDRISFLEFRTGLAIGLGRLDEAQASNRDAVALATASGNFRSVVRCWGNFAGVLALAGERELARVGFGHALETMRSKHVGGLTGNWTLVYLAYAAWCEGDLTHARTLVAQLLAAGVDMKSFRAHLAGVGIRVGLLLDDSDLVERSAGRDLLDFALSSSSSMLIGACASFADREVARGKPEEARALLHRACQALERLRAIPPPWEAHRLFLTVARHGEDTDIKPVRALFEQIAQASDVRSTAPHVALFDACAAARRGDTGRSRSLALEAAKKFSGIGWPLHEAQALEAAGDAAAALSIYRRAGATAEVRRLQAAAPGAASGRREPTALTAREREILDQIVTGKTNRAIARALVISERTVENHVSSVLAKTGVSSRTELIAKLKGGSHEADA